MDRNIACHIDDTCLQSLTQFIQTDRICPYSILIRITDRPAQESQCHHPVDVPNCYLHHARPGYSHEKGVLFIPINKKFCQFTENAPVPFLRILPRKQCKLEVAIKLPIRSGITDLITLLVFQIIGKFERPAILCLKSRVPILPILLI